MKILSIGNSFSQDAHRYIKGVCEADGLEVRNVNLYIGGCSFERHYNNMVTGECAYSLEESGVSTGRMISLDDALALDDWDVITLQEVSWRSVKVENYEPYMSAIAAHVRERVPSAKIYLHKTWGYESLSEKVISRGYERQTEMYADICRACDEAKRIIGADGIIPAGEAMDKLALLGYKVHRDTFHASLALGRYAIALTWVKALFGAAAAGNSFRAFDEPLSDEDIAVVQRVVDEIQL